VSARFITYLQRPVRPIVDTVSLLGRIAGAIAETLGLVGLGLGVLLQLWQLLFRNLGLLRDLPEWVNDASTLALVCGAVIYAAASQTHLGFEGLATALRRKELQRRIDVATKPIVAACLIILVYAGWEFAQQTRVVGGSYSTTFWSPLWIFYLLFPVALALAAIRWLGRRPEDTEQAIAEARAEDIERAHSELAEHELADHGLTDDPGQGANREDTGTSR
jgi:TRAP-type C4-dicarboxylate transport system permease small subunit